LNGLSAFISTKESIANSYRIRAHWEDAISVNPNDATAKALLGRCTLRLAWTAVMTTGGWCEVLF